MTPSRWRLRIIAAIIDNAILIVLGVVATGVVGDGFLCFYWWLALLYQVYFFTQNYGQTPGKMAMGLRVVRVEGGMVRLHEALVRFVGYHINTLAIGIGWLWAINDPQRRGWHDILAGTMVIGTEAEAPIIIDHASRFDEHRVQ